MPTQQHGKKHGHEHKLKNGKQGEKQGKEGRQAGGRKEGPQIEARHTLTDNLLVFKFHF